MWDVFLAVRKWAKSLLLKDLQECFNGFQGMSGFRCSCLFLNPCGVGKVVGITFPHVRLLILNSGRLQMLCGIPWWSAWQKSNLSHKHWLPERVSKEGVSMIFVYSVKTFCIRMLNWFNQEVNSSTQWKWLDYKQYKV